MESTGLFSTPVGPRKGTESFRFRVITAVAGVCLRVLGLYQRGQRGALDIRRTELSLTLPTLPKAFEGYRILLIADVHMDALDGIADAIADAVHACSVDLCVFNGDYRYGFGGDFEPFCRELQRIANAVDCPDGVLALLGNHDSATDAAFLEAAGIQTLVNETIAIRRGKEQLTLTGVDDVHMFYSADAVNEIRRPKQLCDDAFGIALVHSPELASVAAESGYGLYLCGHTHGGQICLPGAVPVLTGLFTHRRLAKRGIWRHLGMTGFTSFGAGVSGLPVRYFTHGEVAVLTLRRA